ncbi:MULTISPECIES: TetR/AcrR family transcriptional regulator [Methylobacterium]|jgi:AcrR family transcriptional regulator|uniref:TetR/AcrR family transcriptional regulator n=1 Tax=Methylobacterium TaxID=407 RepID=UPI00034B2E45|nr:MULTISPECIES: TetR/AcrR family transcriptional regulator [Methylobacterium]MBN4093479.1 TetR family transcriptional regulator [Methylobacterium sp. OT2]UIN34137.1 TetR/AcrR family transcriptional regulator [Methylobacterium oryzae]SEG66167.1 DNA-binding transcriptional regulator, AcrR family [Methylobacterium sp. 190mf]SEI05155.1 transcriptional regulator, TetR family [Methylobacterium sp. 275MFSha3.1]SEP36101.1 transcriptional regulator, TetR family [Methylobacterium sp. UNC300MFChir4.1]
MATAYHRKKRPELVRRALLDCAAKLALEQGLSAVTVQAVCHAAGVTKGALFHHFPSKQALVEGVVADLIAQLDAEIDAAMAKDPRPYGRYTRAYVDITLHDPMMTEGSQWAALHISILAEPPLRRMVSAWFAERLHRHRDTDGSADLEFVRLAADGAWLAYLVREKPSDPVPALDALRDRLVAMTLAEPSAHPGGDRD